MIESATTKVSILIIILSNCSDKITQKQIKLKLSLCCFDIKYEQSDILICNVRKIKTKSILIDQTT